MKVFQLKWLQRILPILLLMLLNAGPFAFIEQRWEGKDELVIHSPQFLAKLSTSIRQLQIKYSFDVIPASIVPVFKKIISDDYSPGTSFDPISADLLTYSARGPPRIIAML